MSNTEGYCVVLTTTDSEEQAEAIAKGVCEQRFAACAQLQRIKSFYIWKGEQCSSNEFLVTIKTKTALYGEVEAFITSIHAYEVPEILQIPIQGGSPAYLAWIDEAVGPLDR